MTDLHVHILPGVDDGSPNLSTSLEMAEMAAQSGVRILAVTPHANQTGIEGVEDGYVNYESEQLEEQFYRLEREINREHIPISLVRGMEIMSIGPLGKKIRERKLIPLHESYYYLIEVPFDMAPDGIKKRLLEFPAMGKIPVLAHPERYFCVQDTPELLYEFREMGAVLQINKGSVFGRFGEEAERTTRFLLENRLAGCVASDAHGADYRTTDMRPVRQFLEERYGEAYAQLSLKVNPRRILEDRQIFYEPSPERKRKRRWFL